MKIEKEMHFGLQICPCLKSLCPTWAIQTTLPNEFDKTLLKFSDLQSHVKKGKQENSNSKKMWEIRANL
jgi:hypothetical protein